MTKGIRINISCGKIQDFPGTPLAVALGGGDGAAWTLVPQAYQGITLVVGGRTGARVRKGYFSEYFLSTTFFKSKKYS